MFSKDYLLLSFCLIKLALGGFVANAATLTSVASPKITATMWTSLLKFKAIAFWNATDDLFGHRTEQKESPGVQRSLASIGKSFDNMKVRPLFGGTPSLGVALHLNF